MPRGKSEAGWVHCGCRGGPNWGVKGFVCRHCNNTGKVSPAAPTPVNVGDVFHQHGWPWIVTKITDRKVYLSTVHRGGGSADHTYTTQAFLRAGDNAWAR